MAAGEVARRHFDLRVADIFDPGGGDVDCGHPAAIGLERAGHEIVEPGGRSLRQSLGETREPGVVGERMATEEKYLVRQANGLENRWAARLQHMGLHLAAGEAVPARSEWRTGFDDADICLGRLSIGSEHEQRVADQIVVVHFTLRAQGARAVAMARQREQFAACAGAARIEIAYFAVPAARIGHFPAAGRGSRISKPTINTVTMNKAAGRMAKAT